jgi:hypothetical protein
MKPAAKHTPTPTDLAIIDRYLADFGGRHEWASALIEAETGDYYLAELVRRMGGADEDHPAAEAAFDWIN